MKFVFCCFDRQILKNLTQSFNKENLPEVQKDSLQGHCVHYFCNLRGMLSGIFLKNEREKDGEIPKNLILHLFANEIKFN